MLASDSLAQIRQRGMLRVVSRVNPATFVVDDHGPSGLEYELARSFARHLGVKLRMLPAQNIGATYAALDRGEADIAASGLSATARGQRSYLYSTPYLGVTQRVVYRIGSRRPTAIQDLAGKRVMVLARSAAAESLKSLQRTVPGLSWMESTRGETFEVLKQIDAGEVDYAIVNSSEFHVHEGLFPSIDVAFDLPEEEQLSWATPLRSRNSRLYVAMQEFLASYEASGNMELLRERFFGHLPEINRQALRAFAKRVDTRLPKFEKLLQRVAEEEGIDWNLLAAISYQESHWNPAAVSRTGVAGMMMLTRPTAKEMGVHDRLDMEQSLRGGARYFLKLRQQLPEDIPLPDRTWFALAAYNMGSGHLEDARELAAKQGLDPDRWSDVKTQLALLAKREWYSRTRHGHARGWEAENFVSRVRQYHRFLTHHNDRGDPFQLAMNARDSAAISQPDRS